MQYFAESPCWRGDIREVAARVARMYLEWAQSNLTYANAAPEGSAERPGGVQLHGERSIRDNMKSKHSDIDTSILLSEVWQRPATN